MTIQFTSCLLTSDDFKDQFKVMEFSRDYLLNGVCYDQSLYETRMGNHIRPFRLPPDHWNLEDIEKEKSRSSKFQWVIIHICCIH